MRESLSWCGRLQIAIVAIGLDPQLGILVDAGPLRLRQHLPLSVPVDLQLQLSEFPPFLVGDEFLHVFQVALSVGKSFRRVRMYTVFPPHVFSCATPDGPSD